MVIPYVVAGCTSESSCTGSPLAGPKTASELVVVSRTTPATVSAPLIYFQLIAATAIGFLVFGDWPEPLALLGLAGIFASGIGGLALAPKRQAA